MEYEGHVVGCGKRNLRYLDWIEPELVMSRKATVASLRHRMWEPDSQLAAVELVSDCRAMSPRLADCFSEGQQVPRRDYDCAVLRCRQRAALSLPKSPGAVPGIKDLVGA
jgi:hypothetical protein